jgi:carbon monoxide dehydrogenase subunit G
VEFTNEFTVPVGIDRAFEILTDLERVAPCLPGATLEEVDGDTYTGKVKVKVGPMSVAYRGTAEVTEKDAEAKHAVIHAAGKEARGSGTAAADVTADLIAEGEAATKVTVFTDLTVTGKPAQFGRGVMADVGTKLIDTFADRLAAMVEADQTGAGDPAGEAGLPPATEAPPADTPPAAEPDTPEAMAPAAGPIPEPVTPITGTGPRRIAPPAQEPEALDLMDIAGGAVTKRLAPVAALVALVVGVLWWRRRSG